MADRPDRRADWNTFANNRPRGEDRDGQKEDRREERGNDDGYGRSGHRGPGPRYNTSQTGPRELGMVSKLTDSYGFVECVDRKLRVFFHFSHVQGDCHSLEIGDGLEFAVATDNKTGKLVAYDLVPQPKGTVTMEIVESKRTLGEVVSKLLGRGSTYGKLRCNPGSISYQAEGSEKAMQAVFIAVDQQDPTCELDVGCQVEFTLVTHRATGVKRATDILLLSRPEVQVVYGTVESLKDKFGFIKPLSTERDKPDIFFHYTEYGGDVDSLEVGDTVVYVEARRQRDLVATAVRPVDPTTLEDRGTETTEGVVSRTLDPRQRSTAFGYKGGHWQPQGEIKGTGDNEECVYTVFEADVTDWANTESGDDTEQRLNVGDKVSFVPCTHRLLGTRKAVDVRVIERAPGPRDYGYVSVVREGSGVIEAAATQDFIPFTVAHLAPNISMEDLTVGTEVEYKAKLRMGKPCAMAIHPVPRGTVPCNEEALGSVLIGSLEKTYQGGSNRGWGHVHVVLEGKVVTYPFGISALDPACRPIKPGDSVSFRLHTAKGAHWKWAGDIRPLYDPVGSTPRVRGKVVSVDAHEGTVAVHSTKTADSAGDDTPQVVPFYVYEIQDPTGVGANDDVEFYMLTNKHTGEVNACGLLRVAPKTKLAPTSTRKFGPIRQPRGPDGSKGFEGHRTTANPTADWTVVTDDVPLASNKGTPEHLPTSSKPIPSPDDEGVVL